MKMLKILFTFFVILWLFQYTSVHWIFNAEFWGQLFLFCFPRISSIRVVQIDIFGWSQHIQLCWLLKMVQFCY